jgi:arylsulfatase A
MTTRREFLKTVGLGAAAMAMPQRLFAEEADERPNIVLIMADDMGAECLGCYGGTSYKTPNLDRLAAEGMRFENAYCTPLCTPTRVQILTGRYPFRTGWAHFIRRDEFFDPTKEKTFAHVMKSAGYATAVAGKWQLCHFDRRPDHPRQCGFDEHCLWTFLYQGRQRRRYWNPMIWQNGKLRDDVADRFGPDVYCDYLIDFMKRRKDGPFLAYFPMCLVHLPKVQTPANKGAVPKDQPKPGMKDPLFAGMVEYADTLVGRIVKAVDDLGLRRRTLILFTGDNGTPPQFTSMLAGQPIKGGKGTVTEQGARVPLIGNWPGTTPAGQVTDQLVDFTDILPTLADLGGAKAPAGVTIDGRSFLPQLQGRPGKPRDWVYCQYLDDFFIRDKRWRLHSDGRFADMSDRYNPKTADPGDPAAAAARRRLEAALAALRKNKT